MTSSAPAAAPAAAPTARSVLARSKIMSTAERLYAEYGFASVSIRKIGEVAGQRNKSAVQYHFTNRDELIMAILAQHADAIEKHRIAMVEVLAAPGEASPQERMACLILPSIEHHIGLGIPSWYGRFLAQAVVEPTVREYAVQAHLNTPSFRRLVELGHLRGPDHDPELLAQHGVMIRQLIVHMCAEMEADLAHNRIAAAQAERSWRRLGQNLITAVCGLSAALLGKANPGSSDGDVYEEL